MAEQISCSVCGTTADALPLMWSSSTGARGVVTYACDVCTRTHLRAIEAKLDEEFW